MDVRAFPQFVEAGPQFVQRLSGVEIQYRPGPFDAVAQPHAREVCRADEGAPRAICALEKVGLGVEAAARVAVDAGLESAMEPA